jgi:hypothetical protein
VVIRDAGFTSGGELLVEDFWGISESIEPKQRPNRLRKVCQTIIFLLCV